MKKRSLYRLLLPGFMLLCIGEPSIAQLHPSLYDYPHNHLKWYTIEGDHFMVHYQEGNSRAAQTSIGIADEIYGPITSLYSYQPKKKVSIILRDREDFSNGAAYFFDDKIEIWLPALDTPFRGTHDWLKNVITHEFVHIVQLGASMRRTQRIPAIYLQWLSYEDVRRPDVLYGFPNGIVTYPFATVSLPAWFVEGSAQYQTDELQYDFWDSHRDMMLRARIVSDTPLTLNEMGHFNSKNSLERELVYNQGFDFVNYLTHQYGEQIVADLTRYSAESKINNFSRVMEEVTGFDADSLFNGWVQDRREFYRKLLESVTPTPVEEVRSDGFLNFFPIRHPDSGVFAYITNRGRDSGRTSLVIESEHDEIVIEELGGEYQFNPEQYYRYSHGYESNVSIEYISTRYSFSPDGNEIVYSRPRLNRYGETYNDLFTIDLESGQKNRLTQSARIQDPDWHPSESKVVAVQYRSGTQNIVTVSIDTGEIDQLTHFQHGETVYTPVWAADGERIYFAAANESNRQIYQIDYTTNEIFAILKDKEIDFRDPWPHTQNGTETLYFSSDMTGIFNIYALHPENRSLRQVTSLIGGAFMPSVTDSVLYFSEYNSDGYRISSLNLQTAVELSTSDTLLSNRFLHDFEADKAVRQFDSPGTDLESELTLPFDESAQREEVTIKVDGKTKTWRPYTETTTGLSIFPAVRFDNYSKLRGSNSVLLSSGKIGDLGMNLWRDVKIGAYFSLRDVTEKLSFFGGILAGPGSVQSSGLTGFLSPTRLNNLDRDIFFVTEHRGIPFIQRSWSPTITVEVYNLKRNVSDGLVIEEFPCTSCLPAERGINIRYTMWEANLLLRSKLNRWSMLELGAGYSPYSVSTESFFSEEFRERIPGTTSEYFRGSRYSITYLADITRRTRHSDIAPKGLLTSLSYRFEPGRLLQDFEIRDGLLSPVYSRDFNHSIEFRKRVGFGIAGETTGMLTTRGFTYLNRPDNYFYMDYTGGLIGMRSYPYFALGGRHTLFTRMSIVHPIFTGINRQMGATTLDKVFAHLFYEAGNGWGGPLNIGDDMKSGFGAELRFALNNYYMFPMKFFINTTYGLNRYDITLPGEFITSSGMQTVEYGGEFLFYFGLTFDFDFQ